MTQGVERGGFDKDGRQRFCGCGPTPNDHGPWTRAPVVIEGGADRAKGPRSPGLRSSGGGAPPSCGGRSSAAGAVGEDYKSGPEAPASPRSPAARALESRPEGVAVPDLPGADFRTGGLQSAWLAPGGLPGFGWGLRALNRSGNLHDVDHRVVSRHDVHRVGVCVQVRLVHGSGQYPEQITRREIDLSFRKDLMAEGVGRGTEGLRRPAAANSR